MELNDDKALKAGDGEISDDDDNNNNNNEQL